MRLTQQDKNFIESNLQELRELATNSAPVPSYVIDYFRQRFPRLCLTCNRVILTQIRNLLKIYYEQRNI